MAKKKWRTFKIVAMVFVGLYVVGAISDFLNKAIEDSESMAAEKVKTISYKDVIINDEIRVNDKKSLYICTIKKPFDTVSIEGLLPVIKVNAHTGKSDLFYIFESNTVKWSDFNPDGGYSSKWDFDNSKDINYVDYQIWAREQPGWKGTIFSVMNRDVGIHMTPEMK